MSSGRQAAGIRTIGEGTRIRLSVLAPDASSGELGVAHIARRRRTGEDVIVIGDGEDLGELLRLVAEHRDTTGWNVVGALGRCHRSAVARDVPWLGTSSDLEAPLADVPVDGLVVASRALRDDDLRTALARARRSGVVIHIDGGLRGIDHRRLRRTRVGHDVLFSMDRVVLPHVEVTAKRVIDVVIAGGLIVVSAPLMAAIALAIRLEDGGRCCSARNGWVSTVAASGC